jgi:thiamine biosynthesis lipoprotein
MSNKKWWLIIISFLWVSMSLGGTTAAHVMKRGQMHMGTLVFITAVGPDQTTTQQAIESGFSEIHRLELLWSTWIPHSELSQVNAAAGKHPVQVSEESLQVLEASMNMAYLTNGGFNITVGPAVTAWNVTEHESIPSDALLNGLKAKVALSEIHINRESQTVLLGQEGMQIDVGGIGKGLAADFAVQKMKEQGATAGVVAVSGDIKTFGRLPEGQRFIFGIQHPRKEQGILMARIELENEAVSTAGDYQRFFMKDGVRYHHILDPHTLKPSWRSQSVTVLAKEGVMADGLDTGIFVMGPQEGLALLERLPGVEGVIVGEDGRVWVSSGLQTRLMWEEGFPSR